MWNKTIPIPLHFNVKFLFHGNIIKMTELASGSVLKELQIPDFHSISSMLEHIASSSEE